MIATTKQTVLIVDDIPLNTMILAEGLADDYAVKIATNGEHSLELARSDEPPDIILLDIMMPGMDGLTVCSLLKEDEHTRNIPVIFISAKARLEDEIQGLELGAVDYITKPFLMPVVKARVRTHLDLKHKHDHLKKLALLDGLTEIPNRRSFDASLQQEWRRNMREGKSLALIMGDIDVFKKFNDQYGHIAGDHCLRKISYVLRRSVGRPGDVVARYGGEEFVMLLPETGLEGARSIAERMRQNVETMGVVFEDSPLGFVTMSFGVAAMIPTADFMPQDLIKAADVMLYIAKDAGRNRVAP